MDILIARYINSTQGLTLRKIRKPTHLTANAVPSSVRGELSEKHVVR
jgi:hypothetical protein